MFSDYLVLLSGPDSALPTSEESLQTFLRFLPDRPAGPAQRQTLLLSATVPEEARVPHRSGAGSRQREEDRKALFGMRFGNRVQSSFSLDVFEWSFMDFHA